ncbi:hypothetical protein BC835DRAFT_1411321 [Cytidiella melzeri]|nr:hypothetical protein BC835DRAFT_1411321 [Cytidiella melzeri]
MTVPPAKHKHNKFAKYPAIQFWVNGTQGLRLSNALQGDLTGLVDAVIEVMNPPSTKVSYKIEWPGYKPLTRQKIGRKARREQSRNGLRKWLHAGCFGVSIER